MSYSALYIKKGKNTLVFLGVACVLSLLIAAFFFIKQTGRQNGWQKSTDIDKVYIVNRSPHGFEVVWSTKNPTTENQWVEVGLEKGTYPIKSSLENNNGVYLARISGLLADTSYYFRIRVGNKTYTLPPLISDALHTPKEVVEKPISPGYGKVILPSTRPYANGLLIYEIDGYYPLAVFTKETGEWLIPLTGLIEKKSNSITSVADSSSVLITLFSYPQGSTRTIVGRTRPLREAITAGSSSARVASTTSGQGESVLGVNTTNSTSGIIYPKENALIPGNTPLIRGVGPIGKDVTVLIQGVSKQYSYRTKADEKGNWLVQSPVVLEAGKYSITATIEKGSGGQSITRRTFTIIKSGEQVLGVATGSPTLIPTSPPIPTYTNPTSIPTSGPTLTQPTPTHYLSPIPTRFIPTSTPPVTGGGMTTFLFGALFCIIVGTGLVLAF